MENKQAQILEEIDQKLLKFAAYQINSITTPLDAFNDLGLEDIDVDIDPKIDQGLLAGITNQDLVEAEVFSTQKILSGPYEKQSMKKDHVGAAFFETIETPKVLTLPFYPADKAGDAEFKARTPIWGTVKALLPLMRDVLVRSIDKQQEKFKRISRRPILEKRIFGILTPWQVGHIPSVAVCSTDNQVDFVRDTYLYKTMSAKSKKVEIDLDNEIFKRLGIDEHLREDLAEDETNQRMSPGTIEAVEVFHEWLVASLYKKQKEVDYSTSESNFKKYFIVPLKLVQPMPADKFRMERLRETDYAPLEGNQKLGSVEYEIDHKLLAKVLRLKMNGYKNEQPNILDWMASQDTTRNSELFVNSDSPSSYFTIHKQFANLESAKGAEIAEELTGEASSSSSNGKDLLFKDSTRISCIRSFREDLKAQSAASPDIASQAEASPVIVLNPARVEHYLRRTKYALNKCSRTPKMSQAIGHSGKKGKAQTAPQQAGMILASSLGVYRYFLSFEQWQRAIHLPHVLAFLERVVTAHELMASLQTFIHPELAVWATTCPGCDAPSKSYEMLEMYGDSILKLAAVLLAWNQTKAENSSLSEKKIIELKDSFVPNYHLFKRGQALHLSKFIFSKDIIPSDWDPPFTGVAKPTQMTLTGKNLADSIESLIGAVFLSSNLRGAFQFIADIKLMPLDKAGILDQIQFSASLCFEMPGDLDVFGFEPSDSISVIIRKYYSRVKASPTEARIGKLMSCCEERYGVGYRFRALEQISKEQIKQIGIDAIRNQILQELVKVEEILGYRFKNKTLLLEAFSHTSFADSFKMGPSYEVLETLGDAILDYVVNSNMIKPFVYQTYNVRDRLKQDYFLPDNCLPFDAHQAKSMLTKNSFLARLLCQLGLQEFVLISQEPDRPSQKQKPEAAMKKQSILSRDCNNYIKYSLVGPFTISDFQIEPYKPPKIFGDVFEAIVGALFVDGGLEAVCSTLQPIFAPVTSFVAKHSKNVLKEPKDDFEQIFTHMGYKAKFQPHPEQERLLISQVTGLSHLADTTDSFFRTDIIHDNGKVMASGWSNSKAHAERNASIHALQWLQTHKQEELKSLIEEQKFKLSFKGSFTQLLRC